MRHLLLKLTCLLAFVMACGATASAQALAGSEWRPTRIGAIVIPERGAPFVQFRMDGELFVSIGCAYLPGRYRAAGSQIHITIGAPPSGACGTAQVQIQDALLHALRSAQHFERQRARLALLGPGGDLVATFAQTDWD